MLEKIRFEKFTAFEKLEVPLAPGINIFVGENGTGKTHVLKSAYAACDLIHNGEDFAEKVTKIFYPSRKKIGRLVKRAVGHGTATLEVIRRIRGGKKATLRLSFSTRDDVQVSGSTRAWMANGMETVYIPVKDMLANAPGFPSLYQRREIHFEEMYLDIILKASLPVLRGAANAQRKRLLSTLEEAMSGKVIIRNGEFFLRNKQGELEFTLLAEGYRKLGLLWLLTQNGSLLDGSVLCWDEPETNLNPKLIRAVVSILVELQRMGVQILIATHDYVVLKEFDLHSKKIDHITYHSLFRNQDGEVELASTNRFLDIEPNAIDEAYGSLISREVGRAEEGAGT